MCPVDKPSRWCSELCVSGRFKEAYTLSIAAIWAGSLSLSWSPRFAKISQNCQSPAPCRNSSRLTRNRVGGSLFRCLCRTNTSRPKAELWERTWLKLWIAIPKMRWWSWPLTTSSKTRPTEWVSITSRSFVRNLTLLTSSCRKSNLDQKSSAEWPMLTKKGRIEQWVSL